MTTERMIFSLNTGRCGTGYLYQMMDTIPNVTALHEPTPAFHENRDIDKSYEEQKKWLAEVKIPYILGLSASTYVETSTYFARGFVPPMLELGYVPDVIVLRRNPREVTMSLWRRNVVPGRLVMGTLKQYTPETPQSFLQYPDYKNWTDYMLCYWHVLEMTERINVYSRMIKEAGGQVVETKTEIITTKPGFLALLEELNLPQPEMRIYNKICGVNFNVTYPGSENKLPAGDIATQEKWVRDYLGI